MHNFCPREQRPCLQFETELNRVIEKSALETLYLLLFLGHRSWIYLGQILSLTLLH